MMFRKKALSLAMLIALTNFGFVSASQTKASNLELNKEYTYNIKANDNQNLVEYNLNLPSKGTLKVEKSKLSNEDKNFDDGDVYIRIFNKDDAETSWVWFQYEELEVDLDKGNYEIKIYTDEVVPSVNNSLKYKFTFTPNDSKDLELKDKYTQTINYNQKISSDLYTGFDSDLYTLHNDKGRDVKVRVKLDEIGKIYREENVTDENLKNIHFNIDMGASYGNGDGEYIGNQSKPLLDNI